MPQERETRRNRLLLLALWLVFYCSFTLFSPPLLDDADSVHAEVAREMLVRHDFITLHANGIRYLEKAPLYYWLMALCMKLFGAVIGLTAASRLPLAGAVAGLTLVTDALGRRAYKARTGLYAGLITLSSFGIFIFTRINIPDALVCLLLTVALYFYFLTEQQNRPSLGLCCAFDAALALTLLTKGLIGIVFPVAIVVLHLGITRGGRGMLLRLRQFHPIASTATLLAVAVPWHILAALANPGHGNPLPLTHAGGHWQVPYPTDGNVHGWAWFYFINEQLYRYLNLRVPHDYDTAPLWLFLGLIFTWLMPWSAFLPTAIARAWPASRRLRMLAPQESVNLLLLLWAAVPLVFFSLSTRQEYYVLPSLPPLILLVARVLAEDKASKTIRRVSRALAGTGMLLFWGIFFFLLKTKAPSASTDLAALLQQNPGDYALSFGHFLDLNAQALGLFRVPLAITAVAVFAGPLFHFILRQLGRAQAATVALAASAFLFLFAAWLGLRTFSPVLTSKQLADVIRPQLHAQDLIAIHGEYEAGSTLGFYLERSDLHLIEGRSSNLWYGSFFPDAPKIFETRESIAQKWICPQRIFLWQDPHDPDRPPLVLPQPVYVLATSGGKQLLSNQPSR